MRVPGKCHSGSAGRFVAALLALVAVGIPSVASSLCGDGILSGSAACQGDCDGSGSVTVDECLREVSIALGSINISACPAGDGNADGWITIDEVVTCINFALNGCPGGGHTDDPAHECDDGGRCVGGSDAGEPCTREADCDPAQGTCFGGLKDLRACISDADCDGGSCRRCRPYGGDGCAANCTLETDTSFNLVPGMIDASQLGIVEGTSGGTIFSYILWMPVQLNGAPVITIGKTIGGVAPAALAAETFMLDRFEGTGIFCACIRGIEARTCGGTLFDVTGEASVNCTAGFPGAEECPAARRCAAVHGPGNTGSGFIGCGAPGVDVEVQQDCNDVPGGTPFESTVMVTPHDLPPGPADGNGFILLSTALGMVIGRCDGESEAYGPDGQFCTDDDPVANRGVPMMIPFTTNTATAEVLNPGDFIGDVLGPRETSGAPFTCNGDGTIGVSGMNLAGAFTDCDVPTLTDLVAPLNIVAE